MNKSTRIYFVRHAQSRPVKSAANWSWTLSELGFKQAEKLAEILRKRGFDAIYCSPFVRCQETFSPFSQLIKRSAKELERLRERTLVLGFNQKNYEEIHRKSWHYIDFHLPGCESSRVASDRIVTVMRELASQHPGQHLLLFSHGQLLSLLLKYVDSDFHFDDQKKIKTPDLYVFLVGDHGISLVDDEAHLCEEVRSLGVCSSQTKIEE